MYQIKHYFDFSNCKFTHSFLISAIWRGSPCRRSSDDANTDWVHCLSPRCRVKWPVISSQHRRDIGSATATVATDANVVPMSPDVALLAGYMCTYMWYMKSISVLPLKYLFCSCSAAGRLQKWGEHSIKKWGDDSSGATAEVGRALQFPCEQ